MPTLRIRFLGTMEISEDNRPLPKPPTLKSQSLLAYLVHHRRQAQPRERLASLFWGDRPDSKARHSLATALWHIRRSLTNEKYILGDAHTVQFDPLADLWLDVDEFESSLAHSSMAHLEVAVALFRGDFLDGFYDDWILNERYRLDSLYSEGLARLMAAQELRKQHRAALSTARRLLRHDPLREDAYRVAMRAHCGLGQRNAALDQYHRCRQIVAGELGAEPMVETTGLYTSILEGRFEVGQPAPSAPAQSPGRLSPRPSGRNPLDALAPSRLVGRERELESLLNCCSQAEGGQARMVFVRGEAGVGKTRLVEELAGRLRWRGARVLWGRCHEFEHLLPYQPVSEALRTLLPALTPGELASLSPRIATEVARLVPELAEQAAPLPVKPTADVSQDRARLLDGVAAFLGHACAHQALLMVIEDLHWASGSTLQMVHYLVRHLADRKVLLVSTLRPEAVGQRHPLLTLQRQLDREGLAQVLHLPRLAPEEVEAMVLEMSGAGKAVIPLAQRLYRETEGNPFYLLEVVKALFEAGSVHLEEGAWLGDFVGISEGELSLPVGLSEAVLARVDRLSEDEQQALRLAAVLGREFDFELLDSVLGRGTEATLEALDGLLRHRLVDESSAAVTRDYAFTHHKIQEVVYDSMPRRHRQHAHARAGAALEHLYDVAERLEHAGELAYHFEQGRGSDGALTEKAIEYLHQAGDRARALYAHQEALEYYQRALALLKGARDYERAARTHMKLGLTYHTAFDYRQARRVFEEGFRLWQQAASHRPAGPPPSAPHALRIHWGDLATRLDPAFADAQGSTELIQQLLSGLVSLSPRMEILPDLARAWDVSAGGRSYIFHLRDDLRWSDDARVTAYDFEYAWLRTLDPATGSPVANLLFDVKGALAFHRGETSNTDAVGVKALDDATLAVDLEGPTGYFLHLLANPATWPVPRHAFQRLGAAWTGPGAMVTNGPFRLESWHPGERVVLTRSSAYHGPFLGNVERVELSLLPAGEIVTALEMYEADRLDVVNFAGASLDEMDIARHRHPGEYVRFSRLATGYVGFNVQQRPFHDVRVRRAFALAIDRESLADVILRGYHLPATGGFVPPGMPGHVPGIGLPYDPDQARNRLSKAGFPGGRGFPTVRAVALPSRLPQMDYLQECWAQIIGVQLSWQFEEPESHWDWLQHDPPHLLSVGWLADYPDPDSFLRTSTIPWSLGWGSASCERLVEAARRVADQPQRIELYRQAEQILMEEARILPLTYPLGHRLVKPWVTRFPTSPLVTQFWKDVVIDPR